MERWIHQVREQLENLLDQNASFHETSPRTYSTQPVSALATAFEDLPGFISRRVPVIFSRLAPFYHSGLLLIYKEERWYLQGAFQQGLYYPLPHMISNPEVTMPQISVGDIKRTSANAILEKLKLNDFLNREDCTALAYRPHHDYLFLLFSELPDLWLKDLAENTRIHVSRVLN